MSTAADAGADAGETPSVSALLDAVGEDSQLTPEEKETTIRFDKRDDTATTFTSEAGLARRLLAHPETDVLGVVVVEGDARPEVALSEWSGQPIVGVRAHVPVGALQVKLSPRDAGHAAVVTERALQEVER